jgi:hypothetical protein
MVSDKYAIWTVECTKCSRVSTSSDKALAEAPFTRVAAEHSHRILRPAANITARAADQAVMEERARIARSEPTWPKCEACGLDQVVRARGYPGDRHARASVSIVLECMSL